VIIAILVVATPLVFATPALAQNNNSSTSARQDQDTDSGVGFGVLGGFNRTSLRGDDLEDISGGSGPMFGIWFGGNRNGRVGFMGEANYVVKKATDDLFDQEVKVTYFEIPALFRINIGNRSRDGVSVYALAGPVFDFKLSEKFEGVEVDTDEFKGVDIGLMIGGGVEVNRLGFEVRGNWGMKNIAQGDEVVSDIKTFTLQILGKFRIN
jgi:hypothetical protein